MSVSGGVSIARIRGENRFYHPPAMRRRLQQQQQQQQKQNALDSNSKEVASSTRIDELDKRTEFDECRSWSTRSDCSVSDRTLADSTNLDRFLEHTTPLVPAQCIPKTSLRGWRTREVTEAPPYFVLGDLWESFKEWSAYGTGVPLLLNGSDSVVQYYVPYLSGIQLYIDPSKSSVIRRCSVDSDAESSKETSSDGSSNCGTEKKMKAVLQDEWIHHSTILGSQRVQMNVPSAESSSDESDSCYPHGQLVFEYLERDPPFCREPLTDKITILASRFPELKTHRSCDLSPSSWISVAWYPIYRIPTGPTLQSLDACFLTFHSLSTAFQGIGTDGLQFHWSRAREVYTADCPLKLQLPIFGLASYKFKIPFWNSTGAEECPKANSLWQAADNWLRLLNVNHPDYRFFASHNSFWR
ncbi:uncharacterized protein LOC111009428 isoform X2 [Momordica charantia]|uniref:Uncharacterized protein LOC111009428 isoform X2 n=1 Tax=Momordica charantia TaxID=3673 RepID=A0A6J1CCE0_MOMCH|nr:uncharacterized protein LOC111009428 isoform X2 [Momordica charantia]